MIGLALSHLTKIRDDVAARLDGDTTMEIKRVVMKLHVPPNANPKRSEESLEIIIDTF